METMEAILNRRSIRHFEDKAIPDSVLNGVLEAIQWSPSWANSQCWEIVVVKELEAKESLKEAVGRNPASKSMVQAPVVLVFCYKKGRSGFYSGEESTILGDWGMFDLGIATQSAALAAYDAGLGTVVVGLFDHAKVADILNVPKDVQIVSMLPMGYPARDGKAPPRRALADFIHTNRFSNE